MPQPKHQSCVNCFYHSPETEEYLSECQRFPPVHPEVEAGVTQYRFPTVDVKTWCGEWRPSEPQTVDQAATEMARFVLLGDLSAARGLADKLIELDQK